MSGLDFQLQLSEIAVQIPNHLHYGPWTHSDVCQGAEAGGLWSF
jgi:hypothetical protein